MTYYIKNEVAKITGLSLRQVQFYADQGFVFPEKDTKTGRGHKRKYTKENLMEFLVLKELSHYGITQQKMMRLLNLFRDHPYFRMYSNSKESNKDIKLYLCFYINSNDALKIVFIIPDVENKIYLPTKKSGYSTGENECSYLIINFGKIIKKLNDE